MASTPLLQRITALREQVVELAGDFDADTLYPHDAAAVVTETRRAINALSAIEASAAERVAQGRSWGRDGSKTPEDWLSRRTGTSPTEAREAIGTARRRKTQTALDAATRKGEISAKQASEISKAATADPAAERRLVRRATRRRESLADLRRECERTKAAAEGDPDAAHARRRAGRHLRKRTCDDGSTEVTHHSTAEETAEIWAACVAVAHRMFLADRARGIHRPEDHRLADALLVLVRIAIGKLDPRNATGRARDGDGRPGDHDDPPREEPAAPDTDRPDPADESTSPSEPGAADTERPDPADDGPASPGTLRSGVTPAELERAKQLLRDARLPRKGEPCHPRGSFAADDPPGPYPPRPPGDPPQTRPSSRPNPPRPSINGHRPTPPRPTTHTGAPDGRDPTTPSDPPPAPTGAPARADATGPADPLGGLDPEGYLTSSLGRGVDAKIIVRIDHTALTRGHTRAGETCDIVGIGPVPVSAVRHLIETSDPFLAAIITKGTDVHTVAHLGRRPNAAQDTALDWTQPGCSVEGCETRVGLQVDHRHDYAHTHLTWLPWLDRFCGPHHDLKTHHGWALVDGTGKRAFVAPDDPRHPRHARIDHAS